MSVAQGKDQETTDWVEVWLINDGDIYHQARRLAEAGDVDGVEAAAVTQLVNATKGSGAWHTARELSANDYGRIDWSQIVETLTAE